MVAAEDSVSMISQLFLEYLEYLTIGEDPYCMVVSMPMTYAKIFGEYLRPCSRSDPELAQWLRGDDGCCDKYLTLTKRG